MESPFNRNFVRFTLGFFVIILLGIAGLFAANWYESNLNKEVLGVSPERNTSAALVPLDSQ